ncbi:cytosine-purine permease [Vararia minispora EC-137]|uniref:Cytosine-purine permease n=1 Tax=Vararia minispora EC-137 TaxID=1314806 RepID=A0ACB8QIX2_9AGAM|nr:cytosine-purine permease [Vararia minispora EC-137]
MSVSTAVRDFFRPSAWVVEPEPSSYAPNSKWSNRDMDPTPPYLRTWGKWSYVAYWISGSFNISAWEVASSMLAVGLSWRQALASIAIGHSIISIPILFNGLIGARLHIPFPVLVRSSFGFWFSYFAVVSRVILSMFWFGIQVGVKCVYQMLKAIWPSIQRLPNRLPESAHVTTANMICFFLYMVIQMPFMILSPQKVKWFFWFKALVSPPACIAMLIWAFVKVPGTPPAASESLGNKHASLSGDSFHWGYMGALNSAIGIWLTLAVNVADFTRYAKSEQATLVQAAIIPPVFTFIGFVGIVVTATGEVLYGKTLWDPTTLIDLWDNRAAAFFASFAFAVGTIGTNISANSLSAATDLTVLFPRYINIRRGQILCAIIGGWAFVPWEVSSSPIQGFLNFMSGYTIFLSPFAAMYAPHPSFWLVHRGKVSVAAMYDPKGAYRYMGGFNWHCVVALLISVSPGIPGLANAVNPSINVGKALHIYQMSALYGFFAAMAVYYTLSMLFPDKKTFFLERPVIRCDIEAPTEDEHASYDEAEKKWDEEKGQTTVDVQPVH